MSNHHCDVFIAGAGPAGLAAAIALRLRGANVLLADARHPPIDKSCGEGLMPDARRALAALGVFPHPHGFPFAGITFVDSQSCVAADFPTLPGLGLRRTTLHQLLCECALALGVRFAFNTPVVLHPRQPPILAGHTVTAKWIIGADGASSRLRAWAGLNYPGPAVRRFGFRAHFRLAPCIAPRTHVEVHWGLHGQAYVTPTAPGEICVSAMTRYLPRDPYTRLVQILNTIPTLHNLLRDAEPLTAERGSLTLTRCLPRVTRGNVALIGDASGSVDAITGEGLALAFRQALLLADSLAHATNPQAGLDLYESRHSALLALPRRMARLLLLLDRHPRLRTQTLRAFSAHPNLFQSLLAVHVGEQPLSTFLLRDGLALASRILRPSTGWSLGH